MRWTTCNKQNRITFLQIIRSVSKNQTIFSLFLYISEAYCKGGQYMTIAKQFWEIVRSFGTDPAKDSNKTVAKLRSTQQFKWHGPK